MRQLIVAICSALIIYSTVIAQSETLLLGVPYQGTSEADTIERLRFTARDGEVISIIVEGENDLDPILEIFDLNGRSIIHVDDYNFPDNRSAILEAFTAPYTGNYDLVVSGYNNVGGEYSVILQAGYANLNTEDNFANMDRWQAVDLGSELEPNIETNNGVLSIMQEGIDVSAHVLGQAIEQDVYYVTADITDVIGQLGWRVGFVFNYSNRGYHEFLLNDNGSWRISRNENNSATVLRDWSSHPAIRAGNTNFTLGILAHDNVYDFFYDSQFIGTITDDSTLSGDLGFVVRTANAFGSRVTATFDNFLLTTPLNESIIPQQLVTGTANDVVRELERRLVIPAGGEMVLNLEESFVQNVRAGVSRFTVANAVQPTNFVLGTTVDWDSINGVQNGCGLVSRDDLQGDAYWLAYVDSDGGYGTGSRLGNEFTENYYNNILSLEQPPYNLILVGYETQLHFYINGYLAHSTTYEARAGNIGQAIVNFEETNTSCNFTDLWLWRFD